LQDEVAPPSGCGPCVEATFGVLAVPDPDWALFGWGTSNDPEPIKGNFAQIPVGEFNVIIPWFVERPGLASLDLVADFGDFLVEIGLHGVEDSVYDLDVDFGGYGIDSNRDLVFEGNGIPDVAEIALLWTVLQDVGLDRTARGGISHEFTWRDFRYNQLKAAEDLPGESAAAVNTIAAYMTLGSYGHRKWAASMAAEHYSAALSTEDYANIASPPFAPDRDLDFDGVSNVKEWELTPGEAVGSMTANESRVWAYAENALDDTWPGPLPPPGGAKAAGQKSGDGKIEGDCPNNDCIPKKKVTLENSEYVQIEGECEGVKLTAGQDYFVPLGSTVEVFVKSGAIRFKKWKALDTMIDGSGLPEESFVVTGPHNVALTVKPVERREESVMIKENGGPEELLEIALEGDLVELPKGYIQVPAQNGTEGFSTRSGWTMAGHEGPPIQVFPFIFPGPEPKATADGATTTLTEFLTSTVRPSVRVVVRTMVSQIARRGIPIYVKCERMSTDRNDIEGNRNENGAPWLHDWASHPACRDLLLLFRVYNGQAGARAPGNRQRGDTLTRCPRRRKRR